MQLLQLLILAIIQGLTEFIPVSSSAHLILVPQLVDGWSDQGPMIDVAVHVGSLGAVVIYFRKEVLAVIRGFFDAVARKETENRKLFFFITVATIPFLVLAPIIYFLGIVDMLRSLTVIGLASIFFGILLWISDRKPTQNTEKPLQWREVIIIGFAQVLAIIPGTSRSGITITAARQLGISRPQAAKFSMLLSIPTISALGLYAVLELSKEGAEASLQDAAIGASLSFIAAYIAIFLFMKMTERMSFTPFVIYRCLLGIALLLIATT